MKTGLITSETYQNHNTGEGHPEKIDRVTAVIDNFKSLNNYLRNNINIIREERLTSLTSKVERKFV